MKTELQSLLEICEDEEKRRDLEKKIRECEIEIKKQVQEESVTVTSSVLVIYHV